jgi:hypothetical protein
VAAVLRRVDRTNAAFIAPSWRGFQPVRNASGRKITLSSYAPSRVGDPCHEDGVWPRRLKPNRVGGAPCPQQSASPSVFICVHRWRHFPRIFSQPSSRASWLSAPRFIPTVRRRIRRALAFFDRSTGRTSRSTVTMGEPPMPLCGVPRRRASRPGHGIGYPAHATAGAGRRCHSTGRKTESLEDSATRGKRELIEGVRLGLSGRGGGG